MSLAGFEPVAPEDEKSTTETRRVVMKDGTIDNLKNIFVYPTN